MKMKTFMLLAVAILTLSLGKSQTTSGCKNGNSTKGCRKECSTTKKSKKMTTENEACPNCGKTSCDKSCTSENTSLPGITDGVCSAKSMEQIKAEADAFQKMDAYKQISSVQEIETGYEFVYEQPSTKLTLELIDFLKLEVKCCPSYNYALIVDSANKKIRYQRFGTPEVKAELKEYLEMVGLLK